MNFASNAFHSAGTTGCQRSRMQRSILPAQACARWQRLSGQIVHILKVVNRWRRCAASWRSLSARSRSNSSRWRRRACASLSAVGAGEGFRFVFMCNRASSIVLAARNAPEFASVFRPQYEGGGAPRGASSMPRLAARALCARALASRRSAAAISDPGSALPGTRQGQDLAPVPVQRSSSRRGRSAPRSGPRTSRVQAYEACPRAPPLAPPSGSSGLRTNAGESRRWHLEWAN